VSLDVYNSSGQLVVNLLDQSLNRGVHQVVFKAGDLSSGVYYSRIQAGDMIRVRKMFLAR
jgi:hypothetical protein